MAYFPMFVDMTERECLIVGGGNVAYRKVIVMLDFGAKVTVVAEDICDELSKLTTDDLASDVKTGSYTANKVNRIILDCKRPIFCDCTELIRCRESKYNT